MDPLKEMFNTVFYSQFAEVFAKADRHFNKEGFIRDVTRDMESLSLNQRLRNTSVVLQKYLPANYPQAIKTLFKAAEGIKRGYTALVLPDFVGLYGKEHFDISMEALKYFTTLGSSEFAIREFIKTDPQKTLKVMQAWARDADTHVRRLSSEGSRPRLPWSFRLDAIIKDPSLTRNILESLKADEELYVRKSVANHLNDISKDNTGYMIGLIKGWDGNNPNTAWIIKHASRTLIKKGHQDSLAIFRFEKNIKLRLEKLRVSASAIKLGETLQFAFDLVSEKSTPQKLVIDYAIHYQKASGGTSKKVFKLKEIQLLPKQKIHLIKKQVFKDFTTRKHYAGKHQIEILINGKSMGKCSFQLVTK